MAVFTDSIDNFVQNGWVSKNNPLYLHAKKGHILLNAKKEFDIPSLLHSEKDMPAIASDINSFIERLTKQQNDRNFVLSTTASNKYTTGLTQVEKAMQNYKGKAVFWDTESIGVKNDKSWGMTEIAWTNTEGQQGKAIINPFEQNTEADNFIQNAISTCPELASQKLERYLKVGLSEEEASQMLQNRLMASYFDDCLKINPKRAKAYWNWLNGDILAYLNKKEMEITSLKVTPDNLDSLIDMLEKSTLSFNQARNVFEKMTIDNKSASLIADELGLKQNSNEDEIRQIVIQTIEEFPQSVVDYKAGKDRAVGFLVGQIMKKTKGKVNPQITSKLVVEILKSK